MKFLAITSFVLLFTNLNAQTKEEYYQKASDLYDKKQYQEALKQVNLALKADSSNAEYLYLKGTTLEKLEQYQQAFDTYSRLIAYHPDYVWGWNQRAILLNRFRQAESAIEDYNK